MSRTRLLLADDHAVLLDGLVQIVRDEFEIIGVALDGRALVEMARQSRADVIVMDITMPQLNGLDAARILRKEVSSAKLLFLVQEAFRAGASGYVLKMSGADEFLKALRCVATGATYLSPLLAGDLISSLATNSREIALTLRQREVLQLLAQGKTMKEVAAALKISTRTAESHKYEMMRQLGVKTTAALIQYAVRIRLV